VEEKEIKPTFLSAIMIEASAAFLNGTKQKLRQGSWPSCGAQEEPNRGGGKESVCDLFDRKKKKETDL